MPRLVTPSAAALGAFALAAALGVTPALAQQHPAATPPRHTAVVHTRTTVNAGRLEKTQDGWRSSRIVGANVYNDNDQAIGTVSDLLIGDDGKVSNAVISVGGFLGIGSKLVSVPYSQLQFKPMSTNTAALPAGAPPPATTATGTAAGVAVAPNAVPGSAMGTALTPSEATSAGTAVPTVNSTTAVVTRIVLPGATKQSLTSMPSFRYNA